MIFPVNKMLSLSAVGTTINSITITSVPSANAYALLDPTLTLTLNDAADLTTAAPANAIVSIPLAQLATMRGQTIAGVAKTTSNGLCISAIPPGVSIGVDFG